MLMVRWWCDGFTPIQYILTNCFLTEFKNYNSDRGDEREWRGEFLHSSWEPSTWSSEPWNMERRERLHWETWWHSQHTRMSCQSQPQHWLLSDTNVSDWDLRYRSAFSRPAAQSIIEQSVNDLTVSIQGVECWLLSCILFVSNTGSDRTV